jgi:hypothetical protein
LVDDQFGRSYAMPDQKLRFPFLDIEFKSQAKNGTHYIAANQVAGAGAIALNGQYGTDTARLWRGRFDFDEPQFFLSSGGGVVKSGGLLRHKDQMGEATAAA